MSVRIARLNTRCRLPQAEREAGMRIDHAVRDTLPRALGGALGPSLDREAAVLRLRALDVVVQIDVATLRRGGLVEAWSRAVTRALHAALARPDGDGSALRRHDSRVTYLATIVEALLAGIALPDWAAPEFAGDRRPPGLKILELLLSADGDRTALLERLHATRQLAPALQLLDEIALERVLRALAEAEGHAPTLTPADVAAIAIALAAQGRAPDPDAAGSRRQAIQLWLDVKRAIAPRVVWLATRALRHLLVAPGAIEDGRDALPEGCRDAVRALLSAPPPDTVTALDTLRRLMPDAAPRDAHAERWRSSDAAGLLLLCAPLARLGWPATLLRDGVDPKVVQAFVLGIAMRLLRPAWQPGDVADPAAALLAGITGDLDRRGIECLFSGPPPDLPDIAATDWSSLLDRSAERLVTAFAQRLRGFTQANRASVVRHFLRRAGRIRIGDDALLVCLDPSPWSVVLRISGADDAIDPLDWLGGRHVRYRLEGL